ncbi:Uncharacterized protein PBTT_06266 [Plasmodiophora brassicae]|uniref:Uncharacterized protein n=1 Tax=Plasmodiophora brassicae TaxID=37360 RepID=A0A0G4J2I5_PLABS|nr:hypothetical protein PBRA_008649 [Plasmodiophora brassicae]SPQ98521.1 unnamed protein product [Plasmodiophora brassicae]
MLEGAGRRSSFVQSALQVAYDARSAGYRPQLPILQTLIGLICLAGRILIPKHLVSDLALLLVLSTLWLGAALQERLIRRLPPEHLVEMGEARRWTDNDRSGAVICDLDDNDAVNHGVLPQVRPVTGIATRDHDPSDIVPLIDNRSSRQ